MYHIAAYRHSFLLSVDALGWLGSKMFGSNRPALGFLERALFLLSAPCFRTRVVPIFNCNWILYCDTASLLPKWKEPQPASKRGSQLPFFLCWLLDIDSRLSLLPAVRLFSLFSHLVECYMVRSNSVISFQCCKRATNNTARFWIQPPQIPGQILLVVYRLLPP
jgi:hypothetical protein